MPGPGRALVPVPGRLVTGHGMQPGRSHQPGARIGARAQRGGWRRPAAGPVSRMSPGALVTVYRTVTEQDVRAGEVPGHEGWPAQRSARIARAPAGCPGHPGTSTARPAEVCRLRRGLGIPNSRAVSGMVGSLGLAGHDPGIPAGQRRTTTAERVP